METWLSHILAPWSHFSPGDTHKGLLSHKEFLLWSELEMPSLIDKEMA